MEQMSQHLYEYGILGILCLAFGYALWKQWNKTNAKNDSLEARVDNLQEQMRRYLDEEKAEMLQVIRDNTKAFVDLKEIMSQLVIKSTARKPKENKTKLD
jgi:cell division protein FtsB